MREPTEKQKVADSLRRGSLRIALGFAEERGVPRHVLDRAEAAFRMNDDRHEALNQFFAVLSAAGYVVDR